MKTYQHAFDDLKTSIAISQLAVFSANFNLCFSKESADLLTKSLSMIPNGKRLSSMTADWTRRLIVLTGELVSAAFVANYVNLKITDFLRNLL